MGNKERGDDGFGSYIVEKIKQTDTVKTLDCQLYPENYLNKILSFQPDLIIFLDAVKNNGGGSVFLRNEEIVLNAPLSVSTHNLPFSSIYRYLKDSGGADVWFVGVTPHSYDKMSDEIMETAARIIDLFNMLDKEKKINIIKIYETLSTSLR